MTRAGTVSAPPRAVEAASGPVVVRDHASRAGPVVVGVDGSPGCRPALEHALNEGVRRSTGIVAVSGVLPPGWVAEDVAQASEAHTAGLIGAVRNGTTAFVERVLADRRRGDLPSPPYAVRVRAMAAVRAILEAIEESDAGLAVVGHRPRNGSDGRVRRSVARELLSSSPCPVTVVPAERVPEVPR